jgi:hypothetical protein
MIATVVRKIVLVSLSSQYGLKAREDIDPRGIRVTNGHMR